MKLFFTVVGFITCSYVYGQTDTVIIKEKPVVIRKQLYYADTSDKVRIYLSAGLGYGMPIKLQSPELSVSDGIKTTGTAFQLPLTIGILKNQFILSAGVQYARLRYSYSFHSELLHENSVQIQVTDTVDSYYTVDHGDTLWYYITEQRDSSYTERTKENIRKKNSRSLHEFSFPLTFGYTFHAGRISLSPFVLTRPKVYTGSGETDFQLSLGGGITAGYSFSSPMLLFISGAYESDLIKKVPRLSSINCQAGIKFFLK